MTYAPATRAIYDADSHIMELPDFLKAYADPGIRDVIPEVSYAASVVTDEEVAEIVGQGNQHSEEHRQRQIAMGDNLIRESKEIQALGAFDGNDRIAAMDLLGFRKQLVFATHSVHMPFDASPRLHPKIRYGGARAHNRHMIDFCAHDSRLMGVGIVPLDDPEMAMQELDFILQSNLEAVWVPHRAAGERSPTHVDLHPFWARLEESGVPFVLHIGGSGKMLDPVWENTGQAKGRDWLGGGENVRSKDMAVLHQGPETFVSMMLMDGMFERFPRLRGACVELGAGWVPAMLTRLDFTAKTWGRVDDRLKSFTRTPTEQLSQQMGFTPYVYEAVGDLIDISNPDLYLFSSDYPHIEGGRDPIGRFESALGDRSEETRSKFYTDNFLRIFERARQGD